MGMFHQVKNNVRFVGAVIVLALVPAGVTSAAEWDRGGSVGADVIVGDLYDTIRWGEANDITAYSLATHSCNVGDVPLPWVASTNEHPVIGQNMYRLMDGRIEQVGMSWLKHGFAALTEDLCDDCQDPGTFSQLGVGCSDPYSASLNGDQSGSGEGGLGPRFEVNPATGFFQYPYTDQGMSGNAIYKRLQVHNDDLDPLLNPGALYFVEGQYITAADAQADNDNNNASYRQVEIDGENDLDFVGETVRELAAIYAWQASDPTVSVDVVDIAGDGRFILAAKASYAGMGRWRYEYALYNMNSDRSAHRFSVPMTPNSVVHSTGFHDVDYHSGEPYDGTDWPVTIDAPGSTVSWSTSDFATDPNANALRWGTLYNFRFEAGTQPGPANVEMFMFRSGSPASVTVASVGPTGLVDVFTDGFESGNFSAWSSVMP